LKSTETSSATSIDAISDDFSNFGSLKSTETCSLRDGGAHDKGISAISAR